MRLMNSPARRRAGFTLVELLVVIGIIATLVALSAGAYFRVMGSQDVKRTETWVSALGKGLDVQWNAAIDDIKSEIKNGKANSTQNNALFTLAGSDPDRANVYYLKLRLRQEFPQTFAEATSTAYATYGAPPKTFYVQAIGSATGASPTTESAILLYLALTQTRRGATFNTSDLGGSAVGTVNYGGTNFNVFIDSWGNPICFERWNISVAATGTTNLSGTILVGELSSTPYVTTSNGTNYDPQDPKSKLPGLAMPGAVASSTSNTLMLPSTNTAGNASTGGKFDTGYNRAPVVYSFGPDQKINTADDILSFRLMVAGQKGN